MIHEDNGVFGTLVWNNLRRRLKFGFEKLLHEFIREKNLGGNGLA